LIYIYGKNNNDNTQVENKFNLQTDSVASEGGGEIKFEESQKSIRELI
jgi:hypothetical protein